MVDVSGIPNMGFGGGGYFGGNAATGQPAMSAAQINAGMWGNYSPGAAQSTLNNIYGAGGFGAQPAYYAALGAAYGRATGGFGGYGAANADPFTPVGGSGGRLPGQSAPGTPVSQWTPADWQQYNQMKGGGTVFDTGASPVNTYGGGANPGGFSPSPNYPGGGDRLPGQSAPGTPVSQWTPADWQQYNQLKGASGGGGSYAGRYNMPDANPSSFNPGSYAGDRSNYGIPYNGRPMAGDIGFSKQPSYPNIGYNPSMQNQFANPAMGGGAFQGRFGMGFPNAGTPSQYYTGSSALPGMVPPGFSGLYGADNQGGALPANGWSGFDNSGQNHFIGGQ